MAMGSWLVLWFFFSLSERARAKEDCGLVPRFFSFFFPLFTLLSRPRNLEDPTAANGRRRFLLGRGQSVSSSRSLSLSLPLSPSLSFPPFSTERITARERKEPRAKGTASQRGGKNMATATKSGRKPSASHPPRLPSASAPAGIASTGEPSMASTSRGWFVYASLFLSRRGALPSETTAPSRSHLSVSFLFPCLLLLSHVAASLSHRRPPPTSTHWRSAYPPLRTAIWTPSPAGNSRR